MKKLLYILAFLPLIANAQINVGRFKGNTIQRNYAVDTIIGYWANNNGTGYAGFLASIDTTNFTAFGIDTLNYDALIYSDNGGFRFIGDDGGVFSDSYYSLTVPSAQLAVNSTTRGFLCPRMTTAQRDLISSPATGLMIYNTTTNAFNYYNAGWQAIGGGGITINSTLVSGGGANRILFENSSNQVSESATDFYFQSASPYAHIFASGRTGTISGVNNTAFGYYAAKALTTGTNGTYIGYNAGAASIAQTNCTYVGANAGAVSTGSYNTFIGSDVASSTSTGSDNVSVGHRSAYGMGSGSRNTIIGRVAGFQSENTVDAVFIGYFSGYSTGAGANYSIFIGSNPSSFSQSVASCIAIGYSAYTTATHQGILGSNDSNGYIDNWYFNGVTHTAPYSVTLRASGFSGSNGAGAYIGRCGGAGTGTGAGGDVVDQTTVKTSSGTTAQLPGDRQRIIGKYTDLTETTATSFARVNVPTSTVAGGEISVTVQADDATDYQARTLVFAWSAANKAGTTDADISTPVESFSASAGTLTVTITAVDAGSGNIDFKADATSSLTQTTLRANCIVTKNFGTGSISAQ